VWRVESRAAAPLKVLNQTRIDGLTAAATSLRGFAFTVLLQLHRTRRQMSLKTASSLPPRICIQMKYKRQVPWSPYAFTITHRLSTHPPPTNRYLISPYYTGDRTRSSLHVCDSPRCEQKAGVVVKYRRSYRHPLPRHVQATRSPLTITKEMYKLLSWFGEGMQQMHAPNPAATPSSHLSNS
jgi:hypothetical protein